MEPTEEIRETITSSHEWDLNSQNMLLWCVSHGAGGVHRAGWGCAEAMVGSQWGSTEEDPSMHLYGMQNITSS